MKVLKITIIMLIILISVGTVCAAEDICDDEMGDDSQDILKTTQNDIYSVGEDSFANLTDEIGSTGISLDLNHDYAFNNETDNKSGIAINKDNFVLNGNGRTIDAKNQSRIFNITANNITLSNLILINGNGKEGGAIYSNGTLTLNNVTFTDNYATEKGGAVVLYKNVTLTCNNTRFIDNYASAGSSIYVDEGNLNLYNSYITSNVFSKRGQIVFNKSKINVGNTTFINIASSYTPALYVEEGKDAYIINSKFINLMANITAGALDIKGTSYVYIKDCEFINTTSSKNAGAILADIAGEGQLEGNVTVLNTIFKDTYSEFGGAYLQLGGRLLLNNSEFSNSHAKYNGGAIYLSYTESEISNCNFTSNGVELNDQGYPTYGGAIFSDISTLNVDNAKFINNSASAGNAIYAYDTSYNIKNSLFENNTNPIYTFFDKESILENNVYINDDNISTNNELHTSIMIGQGMQLTLLNNTINVTTIPASFDLRNYSWVTPVRDQGWMGACWTFGMTSALESALLKATGINADFSENNMQNTMLRYSIYGTSSLGEGGMNTIGTSYLLSWLGAFPQDADTYDELGKISPVITTLNDIHVQDVMFIPNNEIPNGTQLKLAIMKYGALDVSYFGQSTYDEKNPYYNENTYAQYVNETTGANHEVSVVGWDDNFPKEKFLITPPDNGAWIIKNSWDTDWGDEGYLYVSYYDQSFTTSITIPDYATAIIIENTEPYNKNYQYNLVWAGNFLANPIGGNVIYCNQFEAMDDDLIAAVGTYFSSEGINYTVEIYVNGDLKLTQEGVSPYLGYHTIKLNEYIPIKKGDIFQAAITSNVMPYLNVADSRTHHIENISFSCFDGQTWEDNYDYNIIACLKAYTVADDSKIIDNEDITVEYGSAFTVKVATEDGHPVTGAVVNFTINGNTTQAVTDSDGIAKLELSTPLGTYEVTTTYNNKTYTNNVAVKEAKTSLSIIEVDGTGIITGILKDTNGKGIENATVAYTSKNANGTVITDCEGKFTISDVSGEIQLTYSGDETYIGSDAAITLKNTVPLRTGTSIIADDYETYAIDFDAGERGGYFKVQLVDANGNPLVNKTVFIGFNGKVYNKTTNESGWAQLQINLKHEGTYTFAVAFLGDNDYNGSFVVQKNKVNKKATSISAPSKTYKASAKTKSYTVTLKTDKGSSIDGKTYLKAGKKITLKVNGKTYTAKTDSNGKATFKLSLTKKGNFKAVVKFAGDKTYKSAQADTKIKIN
ncbi:C1 family peptidase [uncultured Methanobrevibacter sp.]|uniref:C1 family peptidase n=1 Tax=uncultured Methanobrevibacter sp. TaxID=253161 RepID=UPI00262BB782|nr:C1 family peptidase [uncultured Methanobrevibacter sp.]